MSKILPLLGHSFPLIKTKLTLLRASAISDCDARHSCWSRYYGIDFARRQRTYSKQMTETNTILITSPVYLSRGQVFSVICRSAAINSLGGITWLAIACCINISTLMFSASFCPGNLVNVLLCAASAFVGHGLAIVGQQTVGRIAYLKLKVFVMTSLYVWLGFFSWYYSTTLDADMVRQLKFPLPVYWFFACFWIGQFYAVFQVRRLSAHEGDNQQAFQLKDQA